MHLRHTTTAPTPSTTHPESALYAVVEYCACPCLDFEKTQRTSGRYPVHNTTLAHVYPCWPTTCSMLCTPTPPDNHSVLHGSTPYSRYHWRPITPQTQRCKTPPKAQHRTKQGACESQAATVLLVLVAHEQLKCQKRCCWCLLHTKKVLLVLVAHGKLKPRVASVAGACCALKAQVLCWLLSLS
jgi:hypothetical protein